MKFILIRLVSVVTQTPPAAADNKGGMSPILRVAWKVVGVDLVDATVRQI
jgi:hypothetical protein